ncbi:MAG: sulfurtransferase, partial [Candidatus Limnocylindria bacterium]
LQLTTDAPSHDAGRITLPNETREELRAYRQGIIDGIGSAGRNLVDVRSPEEFRGELSAPAHLPQEAAQRRGHIPGAVNVPWSTAVAEDGTFKPIEQLRELYAAKGVSGDDEIVAYCRIGERSSHTWFVLHELLGYRNVRNYDGSWTEYGSLVGVPIETGEATAN